AGIKLNLLGKFGSGVDNGLPRIAISQLWHDRFRIKISKYFSVCRIGACNDKRRNGTLPGKLRRYQARRSLRCHEGLQIFAVVEKTEVALARFIQCAYVMNEQILVRR